MAPSLSQLRNAMLAAFEKAKRPESSFEDYLVYREAAALYLYYLERVSPETPKEP